MIEKLEVLESFKGQFGDYGMYLVTIKGTKHFVTKNNDTFKILSHFTDGDELNHITRSLEIELLEKLKEII